MKFIETATVASACAYREKAEEKGLWSVLVPGGVMLFDHAEEKAAFLDEEQGSDKVFVVGDEFAVILPAAVCARIHKAAQERHVGMQELVEDYFNGERE